MAEPSRILVVDDEPSITDLLSMALRYEGMEVEVSHMGRDASRPLTKFRPHLVVLDVMLPDLSGFEVLERMGRDRIGGRLPVLFLTARDTLDDKLRGFTLGGDDYMTKPFSVEELIVRVRAILRRAHGDGDDGRLNVSDLRMDEESHEVHRGSTSIELTPTEFKLLHYLMLTAAGGVEVPDPRPRLELRLRRQRQRGGDLHQLPAQEDRRPGPPVDPHRARRGLLLAPDAGVVP